MCINIQQVALQNMVKALNICHKRLSRIIKGESIHLFNVLDNSGPSHLEKDSKTKVFFFTSYPYFNKIIIIEQHNYIYAKILSIQSSKVKARWWASLNYSDDNHSKGGGSSRTHVIQAFRWPCTDAPWLMMGPFMINPSWVENRTSWKCLECTWPRKQALYSTTREPWSIRFPPQDCAPSWMLWLVTTTQHHNRASYCTLLDQAQIKIQNLKHSFYQTCITLMPL